MTTHDQTLTSIQQCCRDWEPQVRLIGNIEAQDIDAAIDALRAERDEAKQRAEEAEGELSDIDDALTDESDDTRVVAVRRLVREHADAVREQRNGEYDLRRIKEAEAERDAARNRAADLERQLAMALHERQNVRDERDAALARVKELEGEITQITERPRYAETPTPGHIIRRCEKCSGLMEIPNQLCLVQLVGCRACSSEEQRDALKADNASAWTALGECTCLMDPPDGGEPTLAELIARMRQAWKKAEADNERLRAESTASIAPHVLDTFIASALKEINGRETVFVVLPENRIAHLKGIMVALIKCRQDNERLRGLLRDIAPLMRPLCRALLKEGGCVPAAGVAALADRIDQELGQ